MSSQLVDEIVKELGQNGHVIEEAPIDLAAEYEGLRGTVAALQRKAGYLKSDVEKLGELHSRSHGEVNNRIAELTKSRNELSALAAKLDMTSKHLLEALTQSAELQKAHSERIGLSEMKITKLVTLAQSQGAEIQRIKTKRLNLYGLIAIVLALGVWGNLLLNASQDINAHHRLNQIENQVGQRNGF